MNWVYNKECTIKIEILTCFSHPTTFLIPFETSVVSGKFDVPVSTKSPHLERSVDCAANPAILLCIVTTTISIKTNFTHTYFKSDFFL